MNVERILSIVCELVLVPVIYVIGNYLVRFIQAKTAQLKAETNNVMVDKYIDMAEEAICKAVIAVNQTYVEALKKQGSFDPRAQDAAFESAKAMALAMMTEDVKEIVGAAVADFDIWVNTTIENMVSANKLVVMGGGK